MSTYGSTVFDTDVQYAPPALPGRGSTSTCPASRQPRKISGSLGEKRANEPSTISTASGQENARASPIGAYWSASSSFGRARKAALASNQRRAIGYASSVALIIASTVSSSSSLSMLVGCMGSE